MDRRDETAAVRRALAAAGISARVAHGRGTGYGWIEVEVGEFHRGCAVDAMGRMACRTAPDDPCGETARYRALTGEARRIVLAATDRRDKGDEKILILTQDARVVQVGRWAPRAVPVERAS